MKCSTYIATSLDGFIATRNGGVDWLESAGNTQADMSDNPDLGFQQYLNSVDCLIMGRKCMEVISAMDLTNEQWPYGNLRIVVLSKSLPELPANMRDRAELYAGDIEQLLIELEVSGHQHAYVDGGTTITSFLKHRLINEMTIFKAPIILGDGIPLFGRLDKSIQLTNARATGFANDFVQLTYKVSYS